MDISQGEHISEFDIIAAGELGSDREHPYKIAPGDIALDGMPYGAWCRCNRCGLVGRSTFVFDYYGDRGDPLKCEPCFLKGP